MSIKYVNDKRVVITGFSITSPAGYDYGINKEIWTHGKQNFSRLDSIFMQDSKVAFGGIFPPPDLTKLPDRKVQKILRTKDLISLITCINTYNHAALKKDQINAERFGMYVGAGCTQIGDLTPYFPLVKNCVDLDNGSFDSSRFGQEMHNSVNPMVVLQNLMNNTLCFASMTLDIRGVNANFMDHQTSGLRAVCEGYESILNNRADIILAGGVSTTIEPFHTSEGVRMGLLADTSNCEQINDFIKPYDAERKGTVLSECAAFIILEDLEHALKRNATIYGEILNYSHNHDASSGFLQSRNITTMSACLNNSVKKATNHIGFVVGNGSGSQKCDEYELNALSNLQSQIENKIPICSIKGASGEYSEASGVFNLIMSLDIIQSGILPATFGFSNFINSNNSNQLAISNKPQEIINKCGLIYNHSIMGSNIALVVSEYQQ